MARGAGTRARGRTVSEAFPTMWRRPPYHELVSNVVEITLQGVIRSCCDSLHITSRKLDQDTVLEPCSVQHQAHQVHPAVQLTPALAQS